MARRVTCAVVNVRAMTPASFAGAAPLPPPSRVPLIACLISVGMIPLNCWVWIKALAAARDHTGDWLTWFTAVAFVQFCAGVTALFAGIIVHRKSKRGGTLPAIFGTLSFLGAGVGWLLGIFVFALGSGMGGAWGRPLRVRGRQLHPELREGSDWTQGDRPDPSGLDPATRRALEALWLHDAQKEHASVPAFSRVSWILAAVGAPAELLEWSHRAAMEEIAHTKACFALAAGYSGRSFTVEPMPDLLVRGALEVKGNALVVLATESLGDGCQLEDFNADVAAACAEGCEEPATRAVLQRIAREERTHADFSWAVLEWLVAKDASLRPAIAEALEGLNAYPRPTAVSRDKEPLVRAADAALLRKHGRLPDATWGAIWDARLAETRRRVERLLTVRRAA